MVMQGAKETLKGSYIADRTNLSNSDFDGKISVCLLKERQKLQAVLETEVKGQALTLKMIDVERSG